MKLKYFLMAGVCTLFTVSCSEDSYLENAPQATLTDETMMSSDGADLLINAAYAALGGPEGQSKGVWAFPMTNWSFGSVRSDDAYKGGGGVGDINEIHRYETFDVDATNGNLDAKWFDLYSAVQRCNSALRVLNASTDDQVAGREIRIAEMKVLRAHFYFELQRLFFHIPYFDETVANVSDYAGIRNDVYTRDELLGMIAKELEDAAKVLPATQAEVGRVNKYIALAYQAKVTLYRAYKQNETTHKVESIDNSLMAQVVSLCDQVIGSGRYDLLADFQGLDLLANENGVESVFAVQYSMNDGTSDAGRVNWSNLLNSPGGGSPYSGDGFFLPSQDIINAYQTDAAGLPVFNYQTLPDYSVYDPVTGTLSNTTPTVDPRLDFVTGRPGITWKTYPNAPCGTWVRDQATYGYNCIKRFWVSPESADMFNGWPWGASALNWQIIRYADVLLWKAEALIEQGKQEEARPIINRIRSRAASSAFVKDFNDDTKTAANYLIGTYDTPWTSQEYARQALRTESRLECAFEGERFFDLVRWGIAAETMNAYLNCEKDNRIYYAASGGFQAGKDEYFPIPLTQYNFSNSAYVQNPGYAAF